MNNAENLLTFAVSVLGEEGAPGAPSGIITRELILHGMVAYWDTSVDYLRGFWRASYAGTRNRYGQPDSVMLTTIDGTYPGCYHVRVNHGEGEGVKVIRANVGAEPLYGTILRYGDLLDRLDRAIRANVVASMRSQIVGVPDTEKFSAQTLLERGARGEPTVVTNALLDAIRTVDVSVPFTADRLQALRQTVYSEAIRRFGGITPNQFKAERVQSAEVSSGIAESVDNIYILIDTVNDDCERLGVPYRLTYAGTGASMLRRPNTEEVQINDPTE